MILWAVALILILYIFTRIIDHRGREIDRMFPGLIRLPFVGNALCAIRTPESMYQFMLTESKKFKHATLRVWIFGKPYIVVTNCKVAKMILSSNTQIDKADEYRFLVPWLGKGLITETGERWRRNRKLITPAFHFQVLHKFFEVFHSNADILIQKLALHDSKEAFDVSKYIMLYAFDNICDSSMGVKVHAQENSNSEYVKATKSINELLYLRVLIPWLRSDRLFKYTITGKRQEKILNILHGYNYNVIKQRKKEYKKNLDHKEFEHSQKEKMAFLDSLLEIAQENKLTDEEIREEVDSIMFAGHDTITSSLSFLLHALAEHQNVQEKVYQELVKIFGQSDRCPTFDDLNEMKYTEQTIKESLRFYTVTPLIARKLNDDFQLNENQYIPKGMEVALVVSAIHRDPEVWSNPDIFDPDRFRAEECKNRHPFAFIPFSAGPRNCIGQKFAMHQMKITVWKILQRFQLFLSYKPEDKIRPRLGLILTSSNGVMIKVQSRNQKNR